MTIWDLTTTHWQIVPQVCGRDLVKIFLRINSAWIHITLNQPSRSSLNQSDTSNLFLFQIDLILLKSITPSNKYILKALGIFLNSWCVLLGDGISEVIVLFSVFSLLFLSAVSPSLRPSLPHDSIPLFFLNQLGSCVSWHNDAWLCFFCFAFYI